MPSGGSTRCGNGPRKRIARRRPCPTPIACSTRSPDMWGPAAGRPAATHSPQRFALLRAFACVVGPGGGTARRHPLSATLRVAARFACVVGPGDGTARRHPPSLGFASLRAAHEVRRLRGRRARVAASLAAGGSILGVALEAIVGGEHVEHPVGAMLDGVAIRAVVRPGDARQVAACVRAAAEAGIALVPCGGRSKLGWGNPCSAAEIVLLDVSRLDQPCELDAREGIARLGAGVRVAELGERLRALGKRTRLPTLHAGATVGGCVAADPFDPARTLDGSLRQDLLGLEVALANGELTRCGGSVVKNVTGFDLVRLYCGSAGTLGVITQVILRLRPLHEAAQALARACASLADALGAVAQLHARGVAPDAALLEPEGSSFRLLWRLEGSRADVDERERRFGGEPVDERVWSDAVGAWARTPAPEEAAIRLAARPGDLHAMLAALHAWCG